MQALYIINPSKQGYNKDFFLLSSYFVLDYDFE